MEHEAAHLQDGQPKPVLGKQHFETVAKGSKEFDEYLKTTLRAGDDEIAIRDQWRNDHYLDADVTQNSSRKPLPKAFSSRTTAAAVSESSDSDSSDDSDTEGEDDEEVKGKATVEEGIAHSDAEEDVDEDELSSADIKKLLKLQALMKKGKKK